jgi:Dolichyl-phosphate-mannose-protein mannosyltransferase
VTILSGRRRIAEILVLAGILVLAAATRLPGLDQRGGWDSDQGHDMRVLAALVGRGEVPLLGPRTSIGTFHHGAAYYALLAPAAFVSGSDPVAVTGELALLGIGAVAAAWWLGRLAGGRAAAAVAGLLAALSPAGIDESTFIWNPNAVPLAAALAMAGALVAWRTGRARWWLLAGLGAMLTMQLHVLGLVLVPPLVAAWVADLRRRRSGGLPRRPAVLAGVGAVAIIAAGYIPLAIHELTADFSETRAILAYLTGGGAGGDGQGIVTRLVMVGLRSVTWPLTALVTDRPTMATLALMMAVGLGSAAVVLARREDRAPAAWLAATLAWSVVALAVAAPSLAVIVPGLPNDHYHAFLDPLVIVLVATGIARVAGPMRTAAARTASTRGPAIAAALLAILAIFEVSSWPPPVSADGGWLGVDAAAARAVDAVRAIQRPGDAAVLVGLPAFKPDDALRFPLERRGLVLAGAGDAAPASAVVTVVCDPLFDTATGLACGGPAEGAWLASYPERDLRLVTRYGAGPRRIISIYAPGG